MSWDERDAATGDAATTDELALFHRTLAQLCRSDVPLSKAFRVLESDLDDARLRRALGTMAAEIDQGTPLAQAYGQCTDVFPAAYRGLVEAGAAAGDVPATLDAIARHAAEQARNRAGLRRALAWPMFTAIIVLLVAGAALAYAAPRLWGFTEAVGGRSPAPYALGALGLVALGLVGAAILATRRRPATGSWAFAWPVIGPIHREDTRTQMAAVLALLVRRERPLDVALELAAETTPHAPTRRAFRDAAARAREGAGLTDALETTGLYDTSVLWLIRGGEDTGDPSRGLEDAARLHRRRLSRKLDRFTLLIRPTAEIVLGLSVFAFAFAYLVPLFDYTRRILWGPY